MMVEVGLEMSLELEELRLSVMSIDKENLYW